MRSVLDFGLEHLVRRLMFSCWHSPSRPNGCQMSFFPWAEDLKHGDSVGPRAAPETTGNEHANWHHLMSHTIASKWNYIHLNLSYTSPKEAQKKSVYLQFIAEWKPQRQKWDMCKLLCIHSILSDESSMYKKGRGREGWHNLCPAYLYDTRLWNGRIKGKLFRTKCELSYRLFMTRRGI